LYRRAQTQDRECPCGPGCAEAQLYNFEVNEMLKVGDKAPEFRAKTDEGKDVSLSDFRGKRVLLFFFPKANTSG